MVSREEAEHPHDRLKDFHDHWTHSATAVHGGHLQFRSDHPYRRSFLNILQNQAGLKFISSHYLFITAAIIQQHQKKGMKIADNRKIIVKIINI